ncbi:MULTISPECIES: 4Fe-4S cluster-binding domain-containing protein [unclassified Clostridium]|uniref:4Fe-4S cluster-binding domain-containing protein n=1 Tax=unclassified Clostridium TaxID=2614128 RepID=UPI00124336CE
MRKLSNYVEIIKTDMGYLLFNKLNEMIVEFETKYICARKDGFFVNTVDRDDLDELENNDFFITDELVQDRIRKMEASRNVTNITNITISVTEQCNLRCRYCYQLQWDKYLPLSDDEFCNYILEYIQGILKDLQEHNSKLVINYIGGEPLLKAELILVLTDKILNLVNSTNDKIDIGFHIDSNIMMITEEFVKHFPKLTINTTFSLPEDHNTLRSSSFEQVKCKLEMLREVVKLPNYNLIIRYNTNHINKNYLESFLIFLNTIGLKCAIDIQNIFNNENVEFINNLCDSEFEDLYISEFVPLLLNYGYNPNMSIPYGLGRKCQGSNILSCKFYSNGSKVLCDAFPPKDDLSTKLCIENEQILQPLTDNCVKCYDYPYCGGPKPCDKEKCQGTFNNKEIIRKRIKMFAKYL